MNPLIAFSAMMLVSTAAWADDMPGLPIGTTTTPSNGWCFVDNASLVKCYLSKPWYGMIVYSDGRVQTNEFNTADGDNHQLCLESLSYVQYGMSIEDHAKQSKVIYDNGGILPSVHITAAVCFQQEDRAK